MRAKNVSLIIDAINDVAGFDHSSGMYKAPATATSLGTMLKKCCKLLQMEYIKGEDKEGLEQMKNLMLIFEMEFNVTINRKGNESQKIIKRRKHIILPTTDTVGQFKEYLKTKIQYHI